MVKKIEKRWGIALEQLWAGGAGRRERQGGRDRQERCCKLLKVNNTMRMVMLALLSASPACSFAPATLPPGWIATAPPVRGSEQERCANVADDEWTVNLSSDRDVLRIAPAATDRSTQVIEIEGGRLVSEDHGEFGGDVWWEPAGPATGCRSDEPGRVYPDTQGTIRSHWPVTHGLQRRFSCAVQSSAEWRVDDGSSAESHRRSGCFRNAPQWGPSWRL